MYRLLSILAEIETLYFFTTSDRLQKLLREARERTESIASISGPCRECHALRQELLTVRQDHDNKIQTLRQFHDSQLQRMRQKIDSIALEQEREKQTIAINIDLDCLDRDPKIARRPYLDPDDSWNKHNLPSVMDLLSHPRNDPSSR